ncbi:NADPH-dependent F420 reductase [Nocardia sp. NPDC056100]|uniref:NADPH-dependent F420 reductase n=1 Tax=Nocardia sp. NPDC056100 TaxID=3345712 RepID=UPI0035D5C589
MSHVFSDMLSSNILVHRPSNTIPVNLVVDQVSMAEPTIPACLDTRPWTTTSGRCGSMRITVIGRGHVGGGLAKRWTKAGHEVTAVGRDGGDATGSEVVVVAVPGNAVVQGLAAVSGLGGQVTIDATNSFGDRPEGFDSVALQVKSIVGGPTAKAFNTNFASIYDAIDAEPVPPGTLFAAEDEARAVTERLIRDAGFDPIHLGDLTKAPLLESLIALTSTLDRGDLGPFFYRFNRPGEFTTS